MNLQKFLPILANCNQGQRLKGVCLGGDYLYNNIFKTKTNKKILVVPNEDFNSDFGYLKLFDICSTNYYPLVLGGDHSIGTSTLLASVKKYGKKLTVIWIDAHADINTYEASLSKNRHGIPVACATGIDNTWFNNILDLKLDFEQIIYVGIRDLDEFEKKVLLKYNIKHYTVEQTFNFIETTNDNIHISFDVDSLDPSILDSTGTMADDGMDYNDVKKIISRSLEIDKLVALDIVEFNPELRDVNKSLETMKKIFL